MEVGKYSDSEINSCLNKLKDLDSEIHALLDKNEKLTNKDKASFNILAALTKHHREELHTRLFRYLLNPKETHACGSVFLRQFLNALKEDNQLSVLKLLPDIPENEIDNAKVEVKDKYSEEFGRMDIYIETKSAIIVIENKVTAPEQEKQIFRYASYCENKNKSYIILYLTTEGNNSKQSGGKNYYSISYYSHIRKWIRLCIESFGSFPTVSVGLKYYLDTLEKSVLNLTTKNIVMELKELLLQEDNQFVIKYLHELHHVLVPVRNELRVTFFKKTYEALQTKGFNFKVVNSIVNRIDIELVWEQMYRGFKLENEAHKLTTANNKIVSFCIEHDWHNLYYGLVVEENSPVVVNFETDGELQKIYEQLNKRLDLKLSDKDNSWLAFRNSSIYNGSKFSDDSLNYSFVTKMEQYVEDFVSEILSYLMAWGEVVQEYKSNSKSINE